MNPPVTPFADVPLAPGDPILGLTDLYNADPRPHKANLGIGIYYDEEGRIPLLESVAEVERDLAAQGRARGYLPIDGDKAYNQATQTLLFGVDSPLLTAGRVVTAQTVGGSGALRVGAELLKASLPKARIALSRPSWENHRAIFAATGFDVLEYAWFDPITRGVDVAGLKADLAALPPGTVVLLHACCHNPTGADLTRKQWCDVADLLATRGLIPFIDMAYQGFSHGIKEDATALQVLQEAGIGDFVVANSYSKSFSLYGERVGALSLVTSTADQARTVCSQIKRIIRTLYSSPSVHGAALVAGVLNNAELHARWEQELAAMRERIHSLRARLVERLAAHTAEDFNFIIRQAGMFSYSGLTSEQVERLRTEHAIYALRSGRINVAALNSRNLETVAIAIAEVKAAVA